MGQGDERRRVTDHWPRLPRTPHVRPLCRHSAFLPSPVSGTVSLPSASLLGVAIQHGRALSPSPGPSLPLPVRHGLPLVSPGWPFCKMARGLLYNLVLLYLLMFTEVRGHHNRWWTCNAACVRCVRRTTPIEELISEFYSGLFSSDPPENNNGSPSALSPSHSTSNPIGGNKGGNPGVLNSSSSAIPGISSGSNPGAISDGTTSGNLGCCETDLEYEAPNTTTYAGRTYQVVHLKQMYQFIPMGRCRRGSTCSVGTCVQIYRAHWVLVFNNSSSLLGPPVSFVPMKVPSHCECLNVGKSVF